MKVVIIADTHGQHKSVAMPKGDVVIHAGDFTNVGTIEDAVDFLKWFSATQYKYKVLVAGNHDLLCQDNAATFKSLLADYPQVKYLQL